MCVCIRACTYGRAKRKRQTTVSTAIEERLFLLPRTLKNKRVSICMDPHLTSRVILGNILKIVLSLLVYKLGMMIILCQVVRIK